MKRLFKNRKILYFTLSITMVLIFTLTVAYAALNTLLKITGNAEVVASSWDIYLDNAQLVSGSATTNIPTITDKTTASFYTTLKNPGDYYMFTIDVVNNGSIDAMIDSIEKLPELSSSQAKYLNYIVEYQNGESISTKQLVEANSFVRLKVKVEFRKDLVASDLPTTAETLNLSFTVKYTQSSETGTLSVPNDGKIVKVVNGDYDTVGSEICIDTECFYVISSTEDSVKMLAKYNLYVGGVYNEKWVAYGDEATGKQDLMMKGWLFGQENRNGTTVYSISGVSYQGSVINNYINNYNEILIDLGVIPIQIYSITVEDLRKLGCSTDDYSCSGAPSWVYSSTYWAGTARDRSNLWCVFSDGNLNYSVYNVDNQFGVRPVITISKSEF